MFCFRCEVSGRVQGVFYRASAQHEAERLGISGYARNLKDGSVEVLACGEKSAIDDFCAWLARGPSQAQVANVSCHSVETELPVGFGVE